MRPPAAFASAALFAALVCMPLAASGCGGASSPESTASPASSQITAPPVVATDETATTAPAAPDGSDPVQDAFASLALSAQPLAVFAPTYLPAGAVLAESWWPMVEWEDPSAYPGPLQPNPYLMEDGSLPQAEVIVQSGNGWIDFLQNFRGDVGDSVRNDVGEVAGLPAALFAISGGSLVQWQYEGLWYGVFARGVAEEDLLRVAGGMRLLPTVESK